MKSGFLRNWPRGLIGLLLILVFPGMPAASANNMDSHHKDIDGYQVELDFTARPIKTGSNEVVVRLYDANAKPVSEAEATVTVAQPAPAGAAEHDMAGTGQPDQAQDSHPPTDLAEADDHHQAVATEHNMDEMTDHAGTESDSPQAAARADHSQPDMADPAEAHLDEHALTPATDSHPAEAASGHGGRSGGHGEAVAVELAAGPMSGEYHGQVSFAEEGRWLVKINFLVQGQAREVEFIVDVVERGAGRLRQANLYQIFTEPLL